ncbi:MAG: ABC transporter ATP-binding protein [Actinomycetota bacterium]
MPSSQATLRRTVAQLEGRRLTYAVATVVAIGEAAAMLTFPLVQQSFYDRVLIGGETEILAPVLLAMLALVVTMLAAKAVSGYLYASVGEAVKVDVRSQLTQAELSRSLTAGDREATGELVSVATNDVAKMGELYRRVFGPGVVQVLRLVGTLAVLAVIDPRLLVVALPLLALYAAVPIGVTPGLRRTGEMVQQRTGQLITTLQEGFSGTRDIKAFGRVGWGVARQRTSGDALREAQLRLTRLELLSSGSFIAYWLSVVGISWYGALAVSENRLTVGGLLALLLYFGQLQQPVSFLVKLNNRLQVGLAASARVFAHLDQPPAAHTAAGGRPPR